MKSILIFIALVGIGVGLWYGGVFLNRGTEHILGGSVVVPNQMQYVEEQQYHRISITHPQHTPLRDSAANEKALETMENFFLTDMVEFKKMTNPDDMHPDQKALLDEMNRKLEYGVVFKEYISSNDKLVSYRYDIYQDTGGAHPNCFFKTFTFDAEGNEIKVGDLFTAESDYLNRLATATYAAVFKQLQEGLDGEDPTPSIFKEGLDAKDENFSNFVIDGDTLIILIPPYQAAAYVAGSYEVPIPLSQFADILQPEWK